MPSSRYIMPGTFPVDDETEDIGEVRSEETDLPEENNKLEGNTLPEENTGNQPDSPSQPTLEVQPKIKTEPDDIATNQPILPSPPVVTYEDYKPEALQAALSQPLLPDIWAEFDGVYFSPPPMSAEEFHANFDAQNEQYRTVCGEIGFVPLSEGDWEPQDRRRAGRSGQTWY
jgi:hypothetical protein